MRRSLAALAAVLMLIVAACGDDGGADATTSSVAFADEDVVADDTGGTTGDSSSDGDMTDDDSGDDDMSGGDMMSGSYADITVDGTTIRFDAGERVFSPIEGVTDVTVETCDPSFFGVGFWVIAYPVDADGEILLEDDGVNIAGIMNAALPFEGTNPDDFAFEFDIDFAPLGIDARYRAEDGGAVAYEFDGNRVTGTATLDQYGEPVEIAFDIVCSG